MWSILCPLIVAIGITGCGALVPEEPCAHNFGMLQPAVEADFFHDGNIAYYRCENCDGLFDRQKDAVERIDIPRKTLDLWVRINGEPTKLHLQEQGADSITWIVEELPVCKGDTVTISDTENAGVVYAYQPEGDLDADGKVNAVGMYGNVMVIVTPDTMTLRLEVVKYPGIVAQINDVQYPMYEFTDPQTNETMYIYGDVSLEVGDRIMVADNVSAIAYDDLSQELAWNHYDYHVDEDGTIVMDHAGQYQLILRNDKILVKQIFAPRDVASCTIRVLDGEENAMEKKLHGETTDLFRKLAADPGYEQRIAPFIQNNGVYSYGSVLTLKAGNVFTLEHTEKISMDHVTSVRGEADCLRLGEDSVEILQDGTYYIRYIPACDSIWIDQLSTGDMRDAAKLFDREIAKIPSYLELYYAQEIQELYGRYLDMPASVKKDLVATEKLESMYRNLVQMEKNPPQVLYYMNTPNTKQVYSSKATLCKGFFTDFYYYIIAYYGTGTLQRHGIQNVQDFVELAQDYDGADLTDLYGIGKVAQGYLLVSDANGILEEQSDKGFFGFCYQNGLYRELIPFFTRFFAFWRLDEHYANLDNRGADMFAEAWAPTVDIAKLFYYNEQTNPVRTRRVMDCFSNIEGVVYGFDGSDQLPQIELRGYIFEGWYADPAFTGEPVTQLDLSNGQIKLYAKWSEDQALRDQESAELVDIYIYNLSTNRAKRTKVTVGYVLDMYETLSENAKSLVQEYETLETWVKQLTK